MKNNMCDLCVPLEFNLKEPFISCREINVMEIQVGT